DLQPNEYQGLMNFSYQVAKAIEKAIPCRRIGMSVIGLEVPHVHVHLIPLQEMEDIRFTRKASFSPQEFQEIANAIKQNLG
ncbi:HIT domain-containing protein, partial [Arthrospira platensis SPKY2]